MQRPDTPLAATPEPQPVSSGLQAAPQMGMIPQQKPATKFEQTANNAIDKIKNYSNNCPSEHCVDNSTDFPLSQNCLRFQTLFC